ncbi:MAG: GNAT family N-acetyltransferase [Sphingomonadales bacterium]|nr:GNAT family N-acetyltransferase [Sphingomonadales bacterium]
MTDGTMGAQWLIRARIDDADWNARVAALGGGSAGYMHTAYLDAVAPGWGALHFADGCLFPIWPRGWGPLRQCRQPWFVQHLSTLPPIGQNQSPATELAERLTQAMRGALKGACLLEFQVDEPPPSANQIPAGWQAIARTTFRLPMDPETARAGYSAHHRRLIRVVDGLHYAKSSDYESFLRVFASQVARKAGLSAQQMRTLKRLLKVLLDGQNAALWTLKRDEELLCGCVLLRSGPRLVYQIAVNSRESMQMGGMHRLVDHILHMPEYKGLIFDFEGSDLPGLQRFYSGFGARPHMYTRWAFDERHPILRRLQRI